MAMALAESMTHQAQAGVRHHPAQFHPFHPGRPERGGDPVQQAGGLHAAAAEVQQDLAGVQRGLGAHPGLRAAAEDDLGGIPEIEVVHGGCASW